MSLIGLDQRTKKKRKTSKHEEQKTKVNLVVL